MRQPPRPSQSLSRTSDKKKKSCINHRRGSLSRRRSTDVRFSKILRQFLESTSRTQLCKATHTRPRNIEIHTHTHTQIYKHINCSSFLTNITELTSYARACETERHCNGFFFLFGKEGERQ